MLRAYLDASRLDGTFCVAAVAFGQDRAIKAEREWVTLYGKLPDGSPRYGHMTDLHSRKKQFAGVDKDEADRLCRGSIAIVNKYASYVSAVSCDVAEVTSALPKGGRPDSEWLVYAHRGVYPACLHWAMVALGTAVQTPRNITYWIEAGDEFSGSARQWLDLVSQKQGATIRATYGMAGYSFVPADEVRLFEAADMVAWEWAKHVSRLRVPGTPIRPSLQALMGVDCVVDGQPFVKAPGRYGSHYTGEPLRRYLSKVQRLMDAPSVEAVEAVVAETKARRAS